MYQKINVYVANLEKIWKNWQINILKLVLYYPPLFTMFCILMIFSAGRIFALFVWSSSFEYVLCVWTCGYFGGLYFMNFLEDPQLGLGQYALHKQQLQAREIWVGNFEKYTLQMQKLSLKAKFVGMEISWNIAIHIPATGENLLYLSFFLWVSRISPNSPPSWGICTRSLSLYQRESKLPISRMSK